MPPQIIPDDEDYTSSEDSDFVPEAVPPHALEESSESESEAEEPPESVQSPSTKSIKRKREPDGPAENAGFENSGDEAIIEKGMKRQKRKGKKWKDTKEVDDETGEGDLVKTRSMRALEKVERKALADTTRAIVDVDSLWASMISGAPKKNGFQMSSPAGASGFIERNSTSPAESRHIPSGSPNQRHKQLSTLGDGPDSMIMIKRTYNFAGKVHTEEKLVARNSAEAKLYLASQAQSAPTPTDSSSLFTKPKRPVKKARRSIFEPVTEGLPQRHDLHFGVRSDSGKEFLGAKGEEAKKLNTVEKSAMDWAGFVDKEGIKDELEAAGKAKGAYRARQEFLARVEEKREEEARRARIAGK